MAELRGFASTYVAHRNYCNYVKKELLSAARRMQSNVTKFARVPSAGEVVLLDMCCGRGGDMFKWDALGIRRVYAFDSDYKSVQEAIRRYKDYRRKHRSPIIVNYHVQSALSSEYIRDTILRGKKVNIVSCMFALHYFSDLRTFLRNVSGNLVPGGLFVGVAPDSTYIKKLLDPDDPYKNDEVSVRWSDQRSYYFIINESTAVDRGEDYFSFRGESLEYLIDKEEMVCLAGEEGLDLVEMKNIADGVHAGHVAPPMSQLYFSFVFRRQNKISSE